MQEAYRGFIRVWFYHRYVILHTNIPTTNTYTVPALPIFVYAVRMYMHVCQASLAKPNILDQISGMHAILHFTTNVNMCLQTELVHKNTQKP